MVCSTTVRAQDRRVEIESLPTDRYGLHPQGISFQ